MKGVSTAGYVKRHNVKTGKIRARALGPLLAWFVGYYRLFSLYGYNTFTFFWGCAKPNSPHCFR